MRLVPPRSTGEVEVPDEKADAYIAKGFKPLDAKKQRAKKTATKKTEK